MSPLCAGGFAAMRALSTRNDAPTRASRPFTASRDGFVLGEGCGLVVLEAHPSGPQASAATHRAGSAAISPT